MSKIWPRSIIDYHCQIIELYMTLRYSVISVYAAGAHVVIGNQQQSMAMNQPRSTRSVQTVSTPSHFLNGSFTIAVYTPFTPFHATLHGRRYHRHKYTFVSPCSVKSWDFTLSNYIWHAHIPQHRLAIHRWKALDLTCIFKIRVPLILA